MTASDKILTDVADYYSAKIKEHGETPQGVDWNGKDGQFTRFAQLLKIIDGGRPFSVNDIGCGFGALYDYMGDQFPSFSFVGVDVSSDMIDAAKRRYVDRDNADYIIADRPNVPADYSVASGIFNVRQGCSDSDWLSFILETLDMMNTFSTKGFAFNCLTSYSDAEFMRDYLYYADPGFIFDHCKKNYSRNVALLHDYDLYEFTILVRKTV